MRKVAIIGIDARRRNELGEIGRELGFEVEPLLDVDEVRYVPRVDLDGLLDEARARLRASPVDGIATYWDFPSSCIAAILAREHRLPGPDLRAVVTFEHKYWSRLLQRKVAPDDTPPFAPVDVDAVSPSDAAPLPYPFWLKPVKSYSGHLGFRVGSADEYRAAVAALAAGIHRLGEPFQQVMDLLDDVPEQVAEVGGSAAIAEAVIDGAQCTLEGHVHRGTVEVHGLFDIHRAEDGSTFTHYTYPSRASADARHQMTVIATDLVHGAGFDDGPFNIEFFIDEAAGRTWILEVNPRISQEHHELMQWVDGATNLQVMARLALGESPGLEPGEGSCARAAKFFVRRHADALVTRVPDRTQLDALERHYAPCAIDVLVRPGDRLSELTDQEPYSYLVAYVHLGADDDEQLHQHYREVVARLGLCFEEDV